MSEPKKPEIFVDDDWKAQAQAEKEKLAEQVERRAAEPAELPPASFESLTADLALQAMMHLGLLRDEASGKGTPVNLAAARYYIDSLAVLKDVTRGNLQPDQADVLQRNIQQLRFHFVRLANPAAPTKPTEPTAPGGK
jgi:hypothetical protein